MEQPSEVAQESVRPATHAGDSPAYTSPEGRHRHECAGCGVVWEHVTLKYGGLRVMHTCPECGLLATAPWPLYVGPKSPQYHDPGSKFFRKSDLQ